MKKLLCVLTLTILTTGCPAEWYEFVNSLDASDLHKDNPVPFSAGGEGGLGSGPVGHVF